LILDLPPYRTPSLANSFRQAWDRGWSFIRDAGTVILVISIAVWALSHYPKLDEARFQQRLARISATDLDAQALDSEQVELMRLRLAQEHSLLGRAGKRIEPLFEPLGFDWKTSVSILASFAAREVVVSTMSVLYDAGEDTPSLIQRVRTAKRADGSPAFGFSNSISLLVFFVLAMQCLPTQAVTWKETGSWKWAAFQLAYMSLLAYAAAFVAKQLCDVFI
jgi:ferrous iron transport protein B